MVTELKFQYSNNLLIPVAGILRQPLLLLQIQGFKFEIRLILYILALIVTLLYKILHANVAVGLSVVHSIISQQQYCSL